MDDDQRGHEPPDVHRTHPVHGPHPSGLRQGLIGLVHEVTKFGAVGAAGLLVNLAVFNLVRSVTDLQVVRASVIATAVAIAFNYVGSRYFTYRDRDKSGRTREMTLFLLFSMAGLVIENGVLYVATYAFDQHSALENNFYKFVGIGIATMFRFWSYRTWVFRALPDRAPAAREDGDEVLTGAGAGPDASGTGDGNARAPLGQRP